MKRTTVALGLLLMVYYIFSLSTYLIWNNMGKNPINGDEPHYLVMASGIAKYGSLEQTFPYRDEFRSKVIYPTGLATPNSNPSPENTHAVKGPHGLFNVHNIGLPLVISLPFMLWGVIGVKVIMVLLSGIAIVIVWHISGIYSEDVETRLFSTLILCVGLPLVPSSNQVYPDILAGIIALSALYWFATTKISRTLIIEAIWVSIVMFLPWLQIKFAAAALLLVIALVLKIFYESKSIKRVLVLFIPAVLSFIALAIYNKYAFGNMSGPYQSGALELSKTSLMVLLGLFFDQNQGLLFQNPVMFVGLFYIGNLFKEKRTLAVIWLLVFLSLIVPNAMHTNWYGGGSFSGRFGWSAVIVFFLPTLIGLIRLAQANQKVFWTITGFSILLQVYFLFQYQYLLGNIDLYNKTSATWLANYSIFYFPIHSWLPAFYNADWAFSYGPNYAWCAVILFITSVRLKSERHC